MTFSKRLCCGTILSGLAVFAMAHPAWAVQTASNDQEEAVIVEEIIVTGSRIRRPNIEAATPVNVLDAAEIQNSGVTNVIDMLSRQPQMGLVTSASSTTNTTSGQGRATLNLRNLGSTRTLVLVNGRRHVAGASGTSAVDVNSISKTTIERVDVVTGGSSAVYGADAVAGVVNFITRQDLDGVVAEAQYGVADGPETYYASIAAGRNFNSGRTNIMGAVTYDQADGLYRHERDYAMSGLAYIPNPEKTSPDDGRPSFIAARNVFTNITNDFHTPVIVTGIGGADPYSLTFSRTGELIPFDRGQIVVDGSGNPQKVSIGGDGLQPRFDALRTPVERYGAELQLRHQFQPSGGFFTDLDFFAEAKYFHAEASSTNFNGTFAGDSPGEGTTFAYRIQADNAFLPQELTDLLTGSGQTYFDITRNDADFGLRTYETVYETTRYVAGFDGAFSNDWRFEVYFNYGQTESESTNFDRLQREFYESIDAVYDPVADAIVCRSLDAQARGCQPLNLFGDGVASQEAIDYSYIYTVRNDRARQWNAVASVTGELFSYPSLFSGSSLPVSFAAGVEWRKEHSRAVPDIRSQEGLIFQNQQQITDGGYESRELFGELNVPLLADLPLIRYLDVNLAYRYQDYTTTGADSSYGVGMEWTVTNDIRFRANFAKAVRAPNINELFSGGSVGFSQIEDPCDVTRLNLGSSPANRQANCAALGLSPNFVQSSVTKPVTSGGNADLQPEEGETLTLGFVLTPRFLPGFSFTADYYNIDITNVIASLGWRSIINNCVDSPNLDNPFCSSVSRGPDGNISSVINQVLNVAEYTTSGWDLTANYRFDLASLGQPDLGSLSFSTTATLLDELTYDPVPGDVTVRDEQAGELPNPKTRINFRATWEQDRLSVSYANQYLSSVVRSNDEEPGNYYPFKAPSHLTHDIRAEYRFDRFSVYAGVNNFTDKNPPYTPFTWLGTSLNTGFNGSIYNNLGRYTYIGINARF